MYKNGYNLQLIPQVRFIYLLLYFRCETFNSFIRARNIFANKLAPSRDIAMSFNTLQHLEFICSGGYLGTFGTEEQAMYIYNYIYIHIYIFIMIIIL